VTADAVAVLGRRILCHEGGVSQLKAEPFIVVMDESLVFGLATRDKQHKHYGKH
jgi:hypothetical protein